MTYRGGQEFHNKTSSPDACTGEAPNIQGPAILPKDGGGAVPDTKAVEEDDWLRAFEDEIASSGRRGMDAIPREQAGEPREQANSQQVDAPPPGGDTGAVGRRAGISRGVRTVRERFAQRASLPRLKHAADRLMAGVARSRRDFAALPRRSQRWLLIAGTAGVSAILWGLFGPSSPGPQRANASELLAQVQMSNSTLKRQLQHLSGELQTVRTEREQLRNEVDALTEERDWLAARLDAVASAGTPIIDGEVPPKTIAAGSTPVQKRDARAAAPVVDYAVGKGDTLWSIARRHNVDVKQLAALNEIGLTDPLKPDQRLAIPSAAGSSVAGSEKSVKKAATAEPAQARGRQVEYTVKRGDSLYAISRQFDVSVEQLRAWNSLGRSAVLQPSQRLIVYVEPATDGRAVP